MPKIFHTLARENGFRDSLNRLVTGRNKIGYVGFGGCFFRVEKHSNWSIGSVHDRNDVSAASTFHTLYTGFNEITCEIK